MAEKAQGQVIIARAEGFVRLLAEAYPKLETYYANGAADWAGLGPRRVIVGSLPIPPEAWDGAEEVKAVPDLPANLEGEELRAWIKANAVTLDRPVQPPPTPAHDPLPPVSDSRELGGDLLPETSHVSAQTGRNAQTEARLQSDGRPNENDAGSPQNLHGLLPPRVLREKRQSGDKGILPAVRGVRAETGDELHGEELPSVPISPVSEQVQGVTLSADDAAYLKEQLERAQRLEALRKREQELDAAIAEQEAEHGRLTILDPAPLPDMAIFSGSPEEYDEALAAEKAARSVERASVWVQPLAGDVWPEPIDFWASASSLPDVKAQWLPAPIADYLLDQSAIRGVDPAQAAISGMVICSALIRESIALRMMADSQGWHERARLWGAIVGDPSTRKGVGIEIADSYLKRLALESRASDERALTDYGHAEKIYQHELADYYRKAKKDPGSQRPEAPERPASNRLWTDDATLESLGKLLSNHARGKILVDKDELAGWFGSFDAYANGKSDKDRPAYLSAYEGKERYIDRSTEGKAFHVPTWSVCILGGIQPEVLAGIASKLGADGMLQRFMIAASKQATNSEERASDEAAKKRWQNICARLLEMMPHPSGPVRLSPEAQTFRRNASAWIQRALKAGFSPGLQAALGKWEGLLGRLMLTAHCIESADKSLGCPEPEVSLATAGRCWSYITEFLWPHALAFYEHEMLADAYAGIKWVAGAYILQGMQSVTSRYLARNTSTYRALKTPMKRKEFFDQMVNAGWLRVDQTNPGKDLLANMPTHYIVNPAVHDGRFESQRESYRLQRARYRELMPLKMPNRFKTREPGED